MTSTLDARADMPEEQDTPSATETVEEPQEPQEPQEDDEQDAEAEEPEEPEEPSQARARDQERELEKMTTKLESERTRHANRVSEIMGEMAQDLLPCPRCLDAVPGFIYPAEAMPLLPEQIAAVKYSIGMGVEPDLQQDRQAQRCPDCAGLGKVATGSLVARQAELKCLGCDGRGWVGTRSIGTAPAVNTENGEVPLPQLAADEEKPLNDPWGRVPGDRNYGILPGYEQD